MVRKEHLPNIIFLLLTFVCVHFYVYWHESKLCVVSPGAIRIKATTSPSSLGVKVGKVTTTNSTSPYPHRIINPPRLVDFLGNLSLEILLDPETTRETRLGMLSRIVKNQLDFIDSLPCSSNRNLYCGYPVTRCGMGCQMHHQTHCLILSYAMGIPLIHELKWPYKSPWNKVFKRLGTDCTNINNDTIFVSYKTRTLPLLYFQNCTTKSARCSPRSRVSYPLIEGIPVSKDLEAAINSSHDFPFLWLVGHFIRHAMRPAEDIQLLLERAEREIKFPENETVVGLHVRRTDKVRETKESRHNLSEYIEAAEQLRMEYDPKKTKPLSLYIASEDHTVLRKARKLYKPPIWNIIGQEQNRTLGIPEKRVSDLGLHSILVDMHFLSKCDYLVCGMSSNACRLVYEILGSRFPDVRYRGKSLDETYDYILSGHRISNDIVPV